MPAVTLSAVSKTFPGGSVGLRPTDLAVESGDRLALLGPTGSGKSTLLRLVAGLDDADGGEIHVGGVRVDKLQPHRRGVAFLPQRPALYPHLTVRQNLSVASGGRQPPVDAPRTTKQQGADAPRSPAEVADLLRLAPLLDRLPHQLSGGERQRVALGKLLARDAPVWLLDEPFSGLDPVFRSEFRHDLHLLGERTGATMLIVTHDPTDALALGRRVGVLGDGQLQQVGTPDALRDLPGNRFVAFCLGRLSLVDGRVGGGPTFVSDCGAVTVPLPAAVARRVGPDPRLTLGVRPEDVTPAPPGGPPDPAGVALAGWSVVLAEPAGRGWLLTLARGRTRVRADGPPGPPPPAGATADWTLAADRCLWFDAAGRRIDDR